MSEYKTPPDQIVPIPPEDWAKNPDFWKYQTETAFWELDEISELVKDYPNGNKVVRKMVKDALAAKDAEITKLKNALRARNEMSYSDWFDEYGDTLE
jgi:hypothetical protein